MPRSKQQFFNYEMDDLHSVKILLCYLMKLIDRPLPEEQLYDIAMDSGVINHFIYSEAIDGLLKAGAFSAKQTENGKVISIEQKGRYGSDYFDMTVPEHYRKSIAATAYAYFAELRRQNECSCEIAVCENGYTVKFSVFDQELILMKTEIYAPDKEQAEFLAQRLKKDPAGFYGKMIGYLLNNSRQDT